MAPRLISLSVSTDGAEEYFQTFQKISEIATDLDKTGDFRYINVSAIREDEQTNDEPELVYTENTMLRVRKALYDAVAPYGHGDDVVDGLIHGLQNAGILFRERR